MHSKILQKIIPDGWKYRELAELLDYEQPQPYLVSSETYKDEYPIPVLTAGKTFVLGYTDEKNGIYSENLPVIIFDDFTTAHKFVDFPFKAKSSAMKILKAKKEVNLKFVYGWMNIHPYVIGEHKRNYLSEYQYQDILTPPLMEQNRIVVVLEAWDQAIEKLSQKIKLKKQIKKGLMQRLFTGKNRLPGFVEQWEIRKLGEISLIKKGDSITRKDVTNGEVPVIAGGQRPAYYHNKSNRIGKTITVSASGAYAGYVDFYNQPIFVSDCTSVKESNVDIDYIYLYLKFKQQYIYSLQSGGAQPHVQPKDLSAIKIACPQSREEQSAIASIFITADKEIQVFQKKLKVLQEQKQYLLNNLIAGIIRIPENMQLTK